MNENMDNDTLEEVGKRIVEKGRGAKANFPNSRAGLIVTEEDRQLVKKLLGEVMVEYKKPKVTSDEELVERINDYFMRCASSGQVPTVEEMCMCTGFSQKTIWDWEVGKRPGVGSESAEIIKRAKHVLKTFDAKLVISGKLNFLAYCFRAKNYYDMSDKSEVVLTPNSPLGDRQKPEDISKRYALGVGSDYADEEN